MSEKIIDYAYDPSIHASRESIPEEDYVIANYKLKTVLGNELTKIAEEIAVESTTGTWTEVVAETKEVKDKYGAKVLNTHLIQEGDKFKEGYASIAFPTANFASDIPMGSLLAAISGNIYGMGDSEVKLLDLDMSDSFLEQFGGPKYGIKGIRSLLDIPERPLVGTIIKPNIGLPPERFADLCYESAAGGIDVIKDDELQTNSDYCPREERLSNVMEKLDEAGEETGKKTLFALNVTGKPNEMMETAEEAIEEGANCLMVNILTTGLGTMRMIAEDPSLDVPIVAHPTGSRAYYRPEDTGTTYYALAQFSRLCGGDMFILSSPYGKLYQPKQEYFWSVQAFRNPLHNIKPTLPMISGGSHPGMMGQVARDLSTEFMLIAGGAIHGHPDGSRAGAKAMLQAAEAIEKGISIEKAAEEGEELKRAVKRWGIQKEAEAFRSSYEKNLNKEA